MSRYGPENIRLEMYKAKLDHTVGKLQIQLSARGPKETLADISYEYTSLGSSGDTFLKEFTTNFYAEFMQKWEKALNHYLKTGEKLHD